MMQNYKIHFKQKREQAINLFSFSIFNKIYS